MYDRLAARLAALQAAERTATNDLCLTQQYRDLLIVQAQIKVLAELIAEYPAEQPAAPAPADPPDGIASDADSVYDEPAPDPDPIDPDPIPLESRRRGRHA